MKKILLFMVLSDHQDELNRNIPLYLKIQEQGVQILLIDCYLPQVPIPSISWDDHGGMGKLVRYVYDQGCKDLAYVTRVNNAATVSARLRGFKDGLLDCRHAAPQGLSRVRAKARHARSQPRVLPCTRSPRRGATSAEKPPRESSKRPAARPGPPPTGGRWEPPGVAPQTVGNKKHGAAKRPPDPPN